METVVKAVLAGLSTVVIHFCFEIAGSLISKGKEIHGLLQPFSRKTALSYTTAFIIQAVAFVFVYLIIGDNLPGDSLLARGFFFGLVIYLLSGVVAIAPMILVFKQKLSFPEAIQVGFVGALILCVSMGTVFVAIWESV